jgi:ABC-type sugar transport system permease subunit
MINLSSLSKKIKRYRNAYIFISPFYILFIIFGFFPLFYMLYLGFYQWNGFGSMKFIGLRNYVSMFGDELFWISTGNTIYVWLVHIFIMIFFALIIAVILNSPIVKARIIYRTFLFLPYCVAIIAASFVFGLIFDLNHGVLNYILNIIGINSIPWLASSKCSKNAIVLLNMWRVSGWFIVVLLAGLQNIDVSVYEAAKIDGANVIQELWYITIPLLKPIILFCFIIDTIGSFKLFTESYILTSGGPANSSLSLVFYIYNKAFRDLKVGYSSAISIMLLIIIILVSLVLFKLWGKTSSNGGGL